MRVGGKPGGLAALVLAAAAVLLVAPRCERRADGVQVAPAAGAQPADTPAAAVLSAARGADPVLCELATLVLYGRRSWNDHTTEPLVGRSADPRVQAAVRWALEPRDAGAVPAVRAALGDPDVCVRRTAARLLGASADPTALEALREALGGEDPALRETAALGLGIAESEVATGDLVSALRDEAPAVRVAAAWALGRIEDRAAVEPLIGRLQEDPDPGVRAAAAWALGEIE